MSKRSKLPWPLNLLSQVCTEEELAEHYSGDVEYVDKAIKYIFNSVTITMYVNLRYKKNMTYREIASQLHISSHYANLMDINIIDGMKKHKNWLFSILKTGDISLFLESAKENKYDVPLHDLSLNVRAVCALKSHSWRVGLNPDGWHSRDIVSLIQSGDILNIHNLGVRTLNNVIIPALKEIGFTDEELKLEM